MKHFKNPVSMRVTEEQFEIDLRKPLEELGAKFEILAGFEKYCILVSNSINRNAKISNVVDSQKFNSNRQFIETYDPEQFIAICKLEVEMIVGECYTVEVDSLGKIIGYLLKNNTDNRGCNLRGCFKYISYDNIHPKEINDVCYSSYDRTIRLSTPKEKTKLDKVIAEQIEVNDEIVINDSEFTPKAIKVIDKVKSDLKQAKKKVKLLTEVLNYLENGNN